MRPPKLIACHERSVMKDQIVGPWPRTSSPSSWHFLMHRGQETCSLVPSLSAPQIEGEILHAPTKINRVPYERSVMKDQIVGPWPRTSSPSSWHFLMHRGQETCSLVPSLSAPQIEGEILHAPTKINRVPYERSVMKDQIVGPWPRTSSPSSWHFLMHRGQETCSLVPSLSAPQIEGEILHAPTKIINRVPYERSEPPPPPPPMG